MRLGPVGQFTVKMLIAAAVVLASSEIVLEMAFSRLDSTLFQSIEIVRADVRAVKSIGIVRIWNRLQSELNQAASAGGDMSPENQKKALADLRVVVDRLRPFIVEASAIIASAATPDPAAVKK